MIKDARVLNARYEVESRLGEGGMATVFGGSDKLLGRKVAIKVLARQYAKDRTAVERFRREAQAAAGLNHPNVVSVFDTGSDDGVHYIVMEQVQGRTLADIIRNKGALPPSRAADIAVGICRALSSAHEKRMVHRDVKPGNVLLTLEGGVKVADFGIARVASVDTLTATGSVMGTASYLSPEQARGGSIDARSDIYSLGCVLYEMLTGKPPFDGETPLSIAYKHVEEEPAPPSSLNPAVPPELEAVVEKAMAKDPDDRYGSAAEMARELGEAAPTAPLEPTAAVQEVERTDVLPVSPQGPASTEPLPATVTRDVRRRWWPLAAVAGALAVLALALALTLGRENPLPTPSPSSSPSLASPSPTTSPTPQATVPPVVAAFGALTQAVQNAAADLGDEATEEILGRAQEAFAKYQEGELGEALNQLGEIGQTVVELSEEGEITTETATPIIDAVNNLALAMEADPPDTSGQGQGKGKGKGKDKDEDD